MIHDRTDRCDIRRGGDGIHGPAAVLQASLDEQTALLTLSHTVFKSGYTYDMATLTAAARAAGALVLWDLSHSAGALPDLTLINEMNVLPDFRAPDTIRLGIAPLYTSFRDIHTAVVRVQQVVAERLYENYSAKPPVVT